MVNDQWLILQHWRGGLQVLLVTKNCFIILGRRFVMWWGRWIDSLVKGWIDSLVGGRIDSLIGGRIDSLVGGRIVIRFYMCDTTLVLGICWLHSSLFTTYPSSFAWLHFSLFILHSSFFTFHFSPHTQAHSLGYILHSSFFSLIRCHDKCSWIGILYFG